MQRQGGINGDQKCQKTLVLKAAIKLDASPAPTLTSAGPLTPPVIPATVVIVCD